MGRLHALTRRQPSSRERIPGPAAHPITHANGVKLDATSYRLPYSPTPVQNPPSSTKPALVPLRVNFAWTFTGNIVYAACQWAILSALAKLGTPEMVGQFALGLAITAPVIQFSNLALRALQATDALRKYRFGEYLALRLTTTMLALLAIAAVLSLADYEGQTACVILAVGLAKAFESISDVFYGLFQQNERFDRLATSLISRGCLAVLLLVLGLYSTRSALVAVAGFAAAWALVLVLYDLPSGARVLGVPHRFDAFKPIWEWQRLFWLACRALPLGLTMMLLSLHTNIPRYFIQHYHGERALGFFAAIAYLMVAGLTVVNALAQSASPRLAAYYARGDNARFTRLLLKLLGIGVLFGLAGIFLAVTMGPQILTLLYRSEYSAFANALVWLAVGAGFSYIGSFLGYGATAAQYYRIQPFILIAAIFSSATSCFLLVPTYGVLGAAWSISLSSVVQTVGYFGCVVHVIGLRRRAK